MVGRTIPNNDEISNALCSHWEGAYFFSQKNTEEQNTQWPTETLSQPITQTLTAKWSLTPSPSPNGEGSDHRDTPPSLLVSWWEYRFTLMPLWLIINT